MEQVEPSEDPGSDSRRRLVNAAVELVLEHFEQGAALRAVFDYLTPRAVAQRAGLSRGLIYHHWGAADGTVAMSAFLDDVTAELWSMSSVPEDLTEMAELLPDNLSDIIVVLTAFEVARLTGPDLGLMRSSQTLTINGSWPDGEADRVVERLAAMYARLGEKVGREPIPPLTYEDLALAVSAAFEGFALLHNVYAERVLRDVEWTGSVATTDPDAQWGLMAITIEGILLNLTRPVGS